MFDEHHTLCIENLGFEKEMLLYKFERGYMYIVIH